MYVRLEDVTTETVPVSIVRAIIDRLASEKAAAAGTPAKLQERSMAFATWCIREGIRHKPTPGEYKAFLKWMAIDNE